MHQTVVCDVYFILIWSLFSNWGFSNQDEYEVFVQFKHALVCTGSVIVMLLDDHFYQTVEWILFVAASLVNIFSWACKLVCELALSHVKMYITNHNHRIGYPVHKRCMLSAVFLMQLKCNTYFKHVYHNKVEWVYYPCMLTYAIATNLYYLFHPSQLHYSSTFSLKFILLVKSAQTSLENSAVWSFSGGTKGTYERVCRYAFPCR